MDRYDLVLTILDANGGTVAGRTVVQKLGYFTSVSTELEDVGYKDYFYGPFSKAVALALEDLEAAMLLHETVRSSPIESYTYTLTDDGRKIVEDVKKRCAKECSLIGQIVTRCKNHCDLQAHPLSCAAKSHHILNRRNGGEGYTPAKVEAMARDFGWNLVESDIKRGVGLLKVLDLSWGPQVEHCIQAHA